MYLPVISIKISKSYVAMFEANCLELAFIHKRGIYRDEETALQLRTSVDSMQNCVLFPAHIEGHNYNFSSRSSDTFF